MHSHVHHDHEHQHEYDPSVSKRIRAISALNGAIGAAEFAAGILTNSSTLTMAGVHDASDSLSYGMKYKAAETEDLEKKRRFRKIGAGVLMGFAVAMGGYEIVHSSLSDEPPATLAAGVGITAAAANIAATVVMHSKRHHADAQDSWRHVVGADLPASLTTLVVTPLSVKYPELDIAGTFINTALAVSVGGVTLRSIRQEEKEQIHVNHSGATEL